MKVPNTVFLSSVVITPVRVISSSAWVCRNRRIFVPNVEDFVIVAVDIEMTAGIYSTFELAVKL